LAFYEKIKLKNRKLVLVDRNISLVSKLRFLDSDGKPIPEEEAIERREVLMKKYNIERDIAVKELNEVENELQKHIQWRRKIDIELTKNEINQNTHTCSWIVKIELK
jgi:hypothetical protein